VFCFNKRKKNSITDIIANLDASFQKVLIGIIVELILVLLLVALFTWNRRRRKG
jgi:hypothetical protein